LKKNRTPKKIRLDQKINGDRVYRALLSGPIKVTRLGQLLPHERLFTLDSFFEKCRICPQFCATFLPSVFYVWILTVIGCAIFWAIFFLKLIWSPWSVMISEDGVRYWPGLDSWPNSMKSAGLQ
jgi:hypothetical protein